MAARAMGQNRVRRLASRSHRRRSLPSRPTRHARPCSVPSGCLTAAMKNSRARLEIVIVAPHVTDNGGVSAATKIFFSPSLYFSVSVCPTAVN